MFKAKKLSKQLAFDVELHGCIFKQGLQQQKSKEVFREEQLVSWLLLCKPLTKLNVVPPVECANENPGYNT